MTDQDAAERDDTTFPEGSRAERRGNARRPARSSGLAWLRESVIILVSALLLSLIVKTFLVQAFFIPSESMHETLIEGDRVLVNKLRPGPFDLRRGDIVVFKDPGGWLSGATVPQPSEARKVVNEALTFVGLLPQDAGEHLIKRIIGLPGDHVACEGDGAPVTVNGVPLDEPYLAPGAVPSISAFDITVPEGTLWLMGDNRGASADSRANMGSPGGPYMPVENVVGTAFVTVWPFDRAGTLTNPSDTFAAVPDPA